MNFGSAAMLNSTYKKVKAEADKVGIPMDEREFHCKGEDLMKKTLQLQQNLQNPLLMSNKVYDRNFSGHFSITFQPSGI